MYERANVELLKARLLHAARNDYGAMTRRLCSLFIEIAADPVTLEQQVS